MEVFVFIGYYHAAPPVTHHYSLLDQLHHVFMAENPINGYRMELVEFDASTGSSKTFKLHC
jgi:hypothetical protein